jgi:hypothetical protein
MEKITDYKLKDFLKIKDAKVINEYFFILDLLRPINSIVNPNYNKYKFWDKKTLKTLELKLVEDLSFADVTNFRIAFNSNDIERVIECVELITGLKKNQILSFTITTFYGIINGIGQQLIEISNKEINELTDDNNDPQLESIKAYERMARFGTFNTIDSLAKEDVLKWQEIEKLPYWLVFTKLKMDKERNDINRELHEMQKRKKN